MPPKDSKLSLGDQKKKLKEKDQRAKDKEKNEKEKERNERKALESKDKVFGLKNKHTSKTVQALVQDVERNAKVIPGEQQKAEAMAREKARVKAGEAQAAKELGALLTKRPDRDADGPLRDAKLDASVAPKPGAKSKGQLASEAQQQQQQRRREQESVEAGAGAGAEGGDEEEQEAQEVDPFAVDDEDVGLDELMEAVKRRKKGALPSVRGAARQIERSIT
jgi:hypothetical protein